MLEKVVVAGENKFMYRPTDNVGFLMYGEDNMRHNLMARGIAPKNHIKANKQQIRQIQTKVHAEQVDKENQINENNNKAHRIIKKKKSAVVPPLPLHLLHCEAEVQALENNENPTEAEPGFKTNKNFGKIPKYLIDRKLQEEEKKRKEFELSHLPPPGSRYASEAEILTALDTLYQNRETVLNMLGNLPLVVDTYGLQKKRDFLMQKLDDIDESIHLYSQPKVCIPI